MSPPTYQNLAGPAITATYVATNAEIAPSLGRNLAVGAGGTALIELIPQKSQYEERINQIDLRFNKIVRVGRTRIEGMLDIYNLLNADTVLGIVPRYGPNWLRPSQMNHESTHHTERSSVHLKLG